MKIKRQNGERVCGWMDGQAEQEGDAATKVRRADSRGGRRTDRGAEQSKRQGWAGLGWLIEGWMDGWMDGWMCLGKLAGWMAGGWTEHKSGRAMLDGGRTWGEQRCPGREAGRGLCVWWRGSVEGEEERGGEGRTQSRGRTGEKAKEKRGRRAGSGVRSSLSPGAKYPPWDIVDVDMDVVRDWMWWGCGRAGVRAACVDACVDACPPACVRACVRKWPWGETVSGETERYRGPEVETGPEAPRIDNRWGLLSHRRPRQMPVVKHGRARPHWTVPPQPGERGLASPQEVWKM
ncbi:hypothetical protein DFH27DRAFT_196788 [Peziza echinospora]|nr:hypothetical protein DFH27DRAFT_196788 [Peziza echinospora]